MPFVVNVPSSPARANAQKPKYAKYSPNSAHKFANT